MTLKDIANIRLLSQQIESSKFKTPKETVTWMGAMQAQDYTMAKWAIGVRLSDATESIVEKAINKGEVIRTHVLRPTWHFASPEDIHWLLDLTAPHIKASMKSRHRELEITDAIITKSNKVLEKALSTGEHLTREELVAALNKAKIKTDMHRIIHLFLTAELDKVICNGELKGRKQTYALLDERAPKPKSLKRDEALALLAKRYFTSHCPATMHDFAWWSGLPMKDVRTVVEMIKTDFISETIGSQTYLLTKSFSIPKSYKPSVHLLPAYDEFTISYKDRSASLVAEHNRTASSVNGIFRPLIVVNGKAVGLWNRTFKKDKVIIETNHFSASDKKIKKELLSAAKTYGRFVGKEAELNDKAL